MKSVRYPIALAALMLVIVPLRAWAGDIQGALAYAPSDSIAVVGADADKLKASPLFAPLFEMFLKESGARRDLAKLKAGTGLDVRRDIHAFVAAFPATFPQDDDEFVVIVEAKVDESRVIAFATKEGAKIERKQGLLGPYYALDGGEGAMAFRGKYVIVGGKKTFQKALRAARGQSAKTHGKLAVRLGTASHQDVFAVADLPAKARQETRGVLPGGGEIQAVAATMDVTRGVQVHAKATTNSPQTASQIASLVQAFIDESRRDPSLKKQGLDSYLSLLSMHATGADLEASLVLTNAQVRRLMGMLKNL